jgi:hypothetical protein
MEPENLYFYGKKSEDKQQSLKTGFGAQNQYGGVIYPSTGNFVFMKKIHPFRVEKGENKPSVPKHWIWALKSEWS